MLSCHPNIRNYTVIATGCMFFQAPSMSNSCLPFKWTLGNMGCCLMLFSFLHKGLKRSGGVSKFQQADGTESLQTFWDGALVVWWKSDTRIRLSFRICAVTWAKQSRKGATELLEESSTKSKICRQNLQNRLKKIQNINCICHQSRAATNDYFHHPVICKILVGSHLN